MRTLRRAGETQRGLDEVASLHAGTRGMPASPSRNFVQANVLAEEAALLACDGRVQDAITAEQRSLELVAPLVRPGPGQRPLATMQQLGQRMAALAMYYQWVGWAPDAEKMARMGAQMGLWPEPLQVSK